MIESVVYRQGGATSFEDPDRAKAADGTTWIRVTDPDPADIDLLTEVFDVHTLSIQDVTEGERPKLEEFEDYTFVVVKTATLRRDAATFAEELRVTPVGVFIGADWVLTLTPEPTEPLDRVWEAVQVAERRLLSRGPDFTAYRILDAIVSDYYAILDEVETRIETVEEAVIESPDAAALEELNGLRRDLLSVRRLFWPARDAIAVLARGDPDQVQAETEKYFRDVAEDLVHLAELADTYRELVVGTREMYLNSVSVSTNEAMKTLTVVATILLPLSFVVGLFGMNFGASPYNMPELGWRYAYPAVLLGLAGIAAVMAVHFHREGWL
jgi:magnesium transporter